MHLTAPLYGLLEISARHFGLERDSAASALNPAAQPDPAADEADRHTARGRQEAQCCG